MSEYTFEIGTMPRTVDVVCLWCGQDLQDGREESGYTGVGPDWCSDGDYGCDNSPSSSEDGVGSHTPNVLATWDGHLIVIDPQPDSVLDAIIPLTNDHWKTTLPVPAGLLPTAAS